MLAVVLAAVLALVTLGSLPGTPAAARPRQDPTTTVAPTEADGAAEAAGSQRVADENRKIWLVVVGLVVVAVALSLLTFRYWRQTRPRAPVDPADADDEVLVTSDDAEPSAAGDAADEVPTSAAGRRSRRAVAGADHAAVDEGWEPRGTGEHDRVEVAPADRLPRPSRDQRAAALGDDPQP